MCDTVSGGFSFPKSASNLNNGGSPYTELSKQTPLAKLDQLTPHTNKPRPTRAAPAPPTDKSHVNQHPPLPHAPEVDRNVLDRRLSTWTKFSSDDLTCKTIESTGPELVSKNNIILASEQYPSLFGINECAVGENDANKFECVPRQSQRPPCPPPTYRNRSSKRISNKAGDLFSRLRSSNQPIKNECTFSIDDYEFDELPTIVPSLKFKGSIVNENFPECTDIEKYPSSAWPDTQQVYQWTDLENPGSKFTPSTPSGFTCSLGRDDQTCDVSEDWPIDRDGYAITKSFKRDCPTLHANPANRDGLMKPRDATSYDVNSPPPIPPRRSTFNLRSNESSMNHRINYPPMSGCQSKYNFNPFSMHPSSSSSTLANNGLHSSWNEEPGYTSEDGSNGVTDVDQWGRMVESKLNRLRNPSQ